MNKLKINNYEISKENSPFIIAEAGINHNGNVERAIEMVRAAKNADVTAIKFQTFKAHEFISDSSLHNVHGSIISIFDSSTYFSSFILISFSGEI